MSGNEIEVVLLGIIALSSLASALGSFREVKVNVPPPKVVEVHHHEKTHTHEVKPEPEQKAPLRHQHRTR